MKHISSFIREFIDVNKKYLPLLLAAGFFCSFAVVACGDDDTGITPVAPELGEYYTECDSHGNRVYFMGDGLPFGVVADNSCPAE